MSAGTGNLRGTWLGAGTQREYACCNDLGGLTRHARFFGETALRRWNGGLSPARERLAKPNR